MTAASTAVPGPVSHGCPWWSILQSSGGALSCALACPGVAVMAVGQQQWGKVSLSCGLNPSEEGCFL